MGSALELILVVLDWLSILIPPINMKLPLWLSAPQAMQLLDVRPQTLYASVSRGRIRARPDPADSRRSMYHRDDVERLAGRSHGRRSNRAVAGEVIRWGDPVMPSAISTVADGRLWYRGQDACALASSASLEAVAGLLWQCAPPKFAAAVPANQHRTTPLRNAMWILAERAATDPPAHGRPLAEVQSEAADVIGSLADAMLGPGPTVDMLLHERLAAAWQRPEAADLLRRALVLMAEHELNASTFSARITASTGASMAACVLSGLATLAGPLHGGAVAVVLALVNDAMVRGAEAALDEWLVQGRSSLMAGFGHRLYPAGDARCAALLACFPLPPAMADLRAAAERLFGEPPNVDFAMAALSSTLSLPQDALLTLFTLSRSVGWVAHALEQQASKVRIRPRARYTGPPVGSGAAPANRQSDR